MPCFYPIKAYQQTDGSIRFSKGGFLKRELGLPCGKCIGCKIRRSQDWAIRCMHEARMHKEKCFITLTYREGENIGSLRYEHFQQFMKDLRQWHARRVLKYGPVRREDLPRVRFFMCGEYGKLHDREHFHACIFGVNFDDRKLFKGGRKPLYRSEALEKLWKYGYSTVGELTMESAAYVAKYCTKTTNDNVYKEDKYRSVDTMTGEIIEKTPEFGRMSLKPGIGASWLDKYLGDVYNFDEILQKGGFKLRPPKYYDELLKRKDILRLEKIKQERSRKAGLVKEDSTPERLAVREKVLRAKLSFKKRVL